MHLNRHQERLLQRIVETREQAKRSLQEALEAGVPQTRVADAAGISRMTLWRRLQEDK